MLICEQCKEASSPMPSQQQGASHLSPSSAKLLARQLFKKATKEGSEQKATALRNLDPAHSFDTEVQRLVQQALHEARPGALPIPRRLFPPDFTSEEIDTFWEMLRYDIYDAAAVCHGAGVNKES